MAIADLPYVHAAGDGGARTRTQMIVIHATDNTASDTAEAGYASHRADKTSAHLYVDGDSAVLCLPLGDIAYGCYPTGNSRSVQFELCGRSNGITDQTLREAAPLVAEVCARYGIPIRKIGPADLVAGVMGICGHADVTAAWHEGDHTDPGSAFPWDTFIGYVRAGGDDMAGADADYAASHVPDPDHPGSVIGSQIALGTLLKNSAALLKASSAPVPVALSAADRAQIVADLAAHIPTAAQIAEELATRLGNG